MGFWRVDNTEYSNSWPDGFSSNFKHASGNLVDKPTGCQSQGTKRFWYSSNFVVECISYAADNYLAMDLTTQSWQHSQIREKKVSGELNIWICFYGVWSAREKFEWISNFNNFHANLSTVFMYVLPLLEPSCWNFQIGSNLRDPWLQYHVNRYHWLILFWNWYLQTLNLTSHIE